MGKSAPVAPDPYNMAVSRNGDNLIKMMVQDLRDVLRNPQKYDVLKIQADRPSTIPRVIKCEGCGARHRETVACEYCGDGK